jgi:hypothetical protein
MPFLDVTDVLLDPDFVDLSGVLSTGADGGRR